MPVVVLYDSPIARIGRAGPLVLTFFREATTVAVLDELDRVQQQVIAEHGKIYSMSIIGQVSSMMRIDESVRKRAIALGDSVEAPARGTVIVLLSKGLASVAVRTFLTGFFLVSKSAATAPTKTVSNAAEGLAFLQALPGVDLSIKTLSPPDIELFISGPTRS
jgi:hypothetical protein